MQLKQILAAMAQYQPSDLHLQVGFPPTVRVQGVLTPTKTPPLDENQIAQMLREVAPPEAWSRIEAGHTLEFIHDDPDQRRYRITAYRHGGKLGAVVRILPHRAPTLKALSLPDVYAQIADTRQGLVIVAGRVGSGRSTTVAALVDHLNTHRICKIVELAGLLEFEYPPKKAMTVQIQIGRDIPTLAEVFTFLMHQNPDVLVLGEIDGWEMAQRALAACDSGILVIATMVAMTAQQALQRFRSFIPPQFQTLALQSLALNLEAICCQRLCRKREGPGRVPATEVLRRSPAILSALEEGRFDDLEKAISGCHMGMRTFDQDLDRLVREDRITDQEAMRQTLNPDTLQMLMRGFGARAM